MDLNEKIETREINGKSGMPAWHAPQSGTTKAPVAIVLHELFRYMQHSKNIAGRFAREGHIGFTINMF